MDQQQLSGIDASFLYLETPETPMHVAGLTYFQLPEGFEGSFYRHFRSFFESRLHTIPIFSKRLAPSLYDLDHPGWVDADDLDLDYHLRETALPAPGTEAQLEEVIGRLHANTLDRSRPLWQFYVITGLENGQGVLYSKVHHAAIDGGAGMAINKALYDVTAIPREVAPPPPKPAAAKPAPSSPTAVDPVKGIADIMGNMMRQQLKMWEAAPQIMNAMTNAFLAKPGEMPKALGTLQSLVSQLPTLNAPKTPFNATITRERSYAARTISLSDAKAIAKASGAKLNDVVMAVCSGALRRYLQEKGQLPDKPLIAGVPISLREPGDTRQNNQVSGMLCQIATDIADPAERLARDRQILVAGQGDRRHLPRRRSAGFRLRRRADPVAARHAGLWPQRPRRSPADADERHDLQRARPADAALLRRRQGDGAASGVDRGAWRGPQHHGAELHGRAQFRPHRRSPRGARCRPSRRLSRRGGGRAQEGGRGRLKPFRPIPICETVVGTNKEAK